MSRNLTVRDRRLRFHGFGNGGVVTLFVDADLAKKTLVFPHHPFRFTQSPSFSFQPRLALRLYLAQGREHCLFEEQCGVLHVFG